MKNKKSLKNFNNKYLLNLLNLNRKNYIINAEYSEKNGGMYMTSKSDFLQQLETLKNHYDKLNEDNKYKLQEAIQVVLTKFEKRV